MTGTTPIPYTSPEAKTRAMIDLFNGEQSLFHPEDYRKHDGMSPLEDLLFEVGRGAALHRNELDDGHNAIPEALAPRKEGTLGEKTPIDERIRALLARADRLEGELEALRAEHDRRVTELLAANNRELERRRTAEAEVERLSSEIRFVSAAIQGFGI